MYAFPFSTQIAASLMLATLGAWQAASAQTNLEPQALKLSGQYQGTHDPSIAKDGDTYYVFATGAAYPPLRPGELPPSPPAPGEAPRPRPVAIGQFPIRCSKDLLVWARCGQVFPNIPQWIKTLSPKTQELWAPDISYFDGQYHLYYAFSVFGKNTSGIALATNVTLNPASPQYKWVDHGLVLQSFATDRYNAIDPNLFLDAQGGTWLSFGSFWDGIKMRRLDRKSGLLSTSDITTYSLASRVHTANDAPGTADLPPDSEAVEAPFIVQHGDSFYLFVSWDLCCRGVKSTYREMVGRSKNVTGPYLDMMGKPMNRGGGSELLQANRSWVGPGGASVLHGSSGVGLAGEDLLVFHAYDAHTGRPALQISTIVWKDGWPLARLGDTTAP